MGVVEILVILLAIPAVIALGLFILHDVSLRLLAAERQPDEHYHVAAADGWKIGVRRYRARHAAGDHRPRLPLVLCHGLGANHFNLDYHDERSLALHLADRGYDCHVIDLRGRASSAEPAPGKKRFEWSFDDYVAYDLPAVIEEVRRRTHAPSVGWVGHSMGGMVMYAYLEECARRGQDANVEAFCAIASPAGMEQVEYFKLGAQIDLAFFGWVPRFLSQEITRALAPLLGWVEPPLTDLIQQRGSVPGHLVRHGAANAMAPISRGEIEQFNRWVVTGEFRSLDGSHVYFQDFDKVEVPACIVVANRDLLARPVNVKRAYELWGAHDKELHEFGREHGSRVDYGHVDIVLGDEAPGEVWPVITRFLDIHAVHDHDVDEAHELAIEIPARVPALV